MKTFYCVTTSFDDRGHIIANITAVKNSEERPQNTYKCTRYKDIYNDWFDTREQAERFIDEAKNA